MANALMDILIKRGTKAQFDAASLTAGELVMTTDTNEVWGYDGTDKFLVGAVIVDTNANRPAAAAANKGRLFYETDTLDMFLDNGGAWVKVGASNLDDIADGTTYGKVLNTYLTTNQVLKLRNVGGSVDSEIDDSGTTTSDILTAARIIERISDAIDGLSWQTPVLDKDLTGAPGAPTTGDRYIVGANTEAVTGIDSSQATGSDTITVAANLSTLVVGDILKMKDSTGNDGQYTINNISGTGPTVFTVDEDVPDATVDGTIYYVDGGADLWGPIGSDEIVEWDGSVWDNKTLGTAPSQGWATHVIDEAKDYVYNGTTLDWTVKVSTSAHNSLSGLQGGTTGQFFHFTSAQHASITELDTNKVTDQFVKRNSGGTAWESVGFGSGANTVTEGDDSRLSDSRTPTGTANGDLNGTYPDPTVDGLGGDALPADSANGILKRNAANDGWEQQIAGDLELAKIGSPAFTTIQDLQDTFHSSGLISGGIITDATAGDADISAGEGYIRATDSDTAELLFFAWSALTGNAIAADATRWIGVEYNAGSPQVVVRTTNDFNNNTDFLLGVVTNESNTLHISQKPHGVGDHASKMIERTSQTAPIARDEEAGGIILGESGTRNVTVSAGALWSGLNRFGITAFDTNVSGGFDAYYDDNAGGFTKQAAQTQWNNLNYDDGSGTLAVMTAAFFANLWFYAELDDEIVMVYGTAEYSNSSLAEGESPPVTPARITQHGKLIGRLTFLKSASTATVIASAFDTVFAATQVTDHDNLSNSGTESHSTIDAQLPSSGEKDALVGSSGAPGSGNKYVTDADGRMSDSRAPTGTAGGDLTGTYPNPSVDQLQGAGLPALPTGGVTVLPLVYNDNTDAFEFASAIDAGTL